MKKDENNINNIYKIDIKQKLDKKKIIIIVLLVIAIILLIIIAKHSIEIMEYNKAYEQYEAQIIALQVAKANQEAKLKEEQERLKKERNPQLTDVGKENISHIYSSEKKQAFLTFDDGPSIQTSSILDILKEQKVKATFFVLGINTNIRPNMVKRIYEEGHYVANHGDTHVYKSIYSSPEAVLDEYNRCNDSIRNAIGNPEYNSHLFRFPGGLVGGKYAEIKKQAKELLNENNIVNVDWNALNGDAETQTPTVEFEMERIKETTQNKNSIVILMHDSETKEATVEALPQIITYLKEQGYEFKNFYEIIK